MLLEASCPRQDRIASAFKFSLSFLHTCSQCLPPTSLLSINCMTLVALDPSLTVGLVWLLVKTTCHFNILCKPSYFLEQVFKHRYPCWNQKNCGTFLWSQATLKIELQGLFLLASSSSQQVTSIVLTCRDSLTKICYSILLTIATSGFMHHSKVHSSCTFLLDVAWGNPQCPLCPDVVSHDQIRTHTFLFQCHQVAQSVRGE